MSPSRLPITVLAPTSLVLTWPHGYDPLALARLAHKSSAYLSLVRPYTVCITECPTMDAVDQWILTFLGDNLTLLSSVEPRKFFGDDLIPLVNQYLATCTTTID